MIFGIGREAGILLYACLTGCTILLAYSILRSVRRLIPHTMLAVGLEDLVFWIGVSIYVFRQIYNTTGGTIRWYFAAGILAGAGAVEWGRRLVLRIGKKIKKKLEKSEENR